MKPLKTYPEDLRVAHWTIVILVAFQYMTGSGMEEAFNAGFGPAAPGTGTAMVHGSIGAGVFFVMLWRYRARRAQAVPPPPTTEPPILRLVSRGVHRAFYIFLLAMPVAGALAVVTGWGLIAWFHGLAAKILWLLILAHIAGAVLHVLNKDGVMARMTGHGADGATPVK